MKKNIKKYILIGTALIAMSLGSFSVFANETVDTVTTATTNSSTTKEENTTATNSSTTSEENTTATNSSTTSEENTTATNSSTTSEENTTATNSSTTSEENTTVTSSSTTKEENTTATNSSTTKEENTTSVENTTRNNNSRKYPTKNFDLSNLVSNGTISQDTSDKISAYLETKKSERDAEREKVKNMTEEERKIYFETNKDKVRTNPFDDMVSSGLISQTDADKIKAALPQQQEKISRGGKRFNLESLVSSGTISQGTSDKISAYLETKKSERDAEREKVKNMTEEERKIYFEAKKNTTKTNIIDEMLSKGIINQAEADALSSSLNFSVKNNSSNTI